MERFPCPNDKINGVHTLPRSKLAPHQIRVGKLQTHQKLIHDLLAHSNTIWVPTNDGIARWVFDNKHVKKTIKTFLYTL